MHVSVAAALLTVASTALAQTEGFYALVKPEKDEKIVAGKTYTIEWTPSDSAKKGDVDILLLAGKTHATLDPENEETIGEKIKPEEGKYKWDVPKDLADDEDKKAFGLKIALSDDHEIFQWSNPFTIVKDGGSANGTFSAGREKPTASRAPGGPGEGNDDHDDGPTQTGTMGAATNMPSATPKPRRRMY